MSAWNLFVRQARAGNFRGTRSSAMRSSSRVAGSEQYGGNLVGELNLNVN